MVNLNTEIQQLNNQIVALAKKINEKAERADQLRTIKTRTPQVIAEEKAKGSIIRFLDQSVTSTRLLADV